MKAIPPVSLFRGLYDRVAKRLGVDPSYVSRVARGERKSAAVAKALAEEVEAIRDHLNRYDRFFPGMDGAAHHDGASREEASYDSAASRDQDGAVQQGVVEQHVDGGHMSAARNKKSKAKSRPESAQES
jgi:transcriptional regulator with XRE-family HTH domain